jgi:hypothetical protein
MICPGCNGSGEWFSECCNGSGGCSCRGQIVPMGRCNVCGGAGHVEDEGYNPRANVDAIQGLCFLGTGPTDGSWSHAPRGGFV